MGCPPGRARPRNAGDRLNPPAARHTTVREPDCYSFRRYLEAKRTVDSRARNRRVRDAFRAALERPDGPVEVCEVGAGTGAMVERVLEWTRGDVRYTAIDADPSLVAAAVENVAGRAEAAGRPSERADRHVGIDRGGARFDVEFLATDAFEHLAGHDGAYDAVVAQAFMDLTDVRAALEAFAGALRPGGVAYLPITFDGVTALLPPVDPDLDDRIERRFHRHMDTTEKVGGATGEGSAGRRLLADVPATGGRVVAAGGSDWVVTPADGGYAADEAYFLHHVVHTIGGALADDGAIDGDRLASWTRARHGQVEAAELSYLAHQLDVLAAWPATG